MIFKLKILLHHNCFCYITESLTLKIISHINQLLAIIYVSAIVVSDILMLFLLTISIVKLEVLKFKFKNAKEYRQLLNCVRDHQFITW